MRFFTILSLLIVGFIPSACAQLLPQESPVAVLPNTLDLYEQERIHIHTRSQWKDWNSSAEGPYTQFLDSIDARVVVRHVKISDEKPWWQHASQTNIFDHFRRSDAAKGRATIVYYRHSEDLEMANQHSDWISLDADGDQVKSRRGKALCLNSAYRDTLISRLQYVVKEGFPILYFDDRHIFTQRCYCQNCQVQFSQWQQKNQQYQGDAADFAFSNHTIDTFFQDLSTSMNKARLPHQFLIAGNNWPALSDLHLHRSTWENFTLKSEIAIPVRANLRGKLRINSKNRNALDPSVYYRFLFSHLMAVSQGSPHIWIPHISTESGLQQQAAGIVALGGIANVDLNDDVVQMELALKELIQEIRSYGPHLEQLKPFGTQTVLFDENVKWNLSENPNRFWSEYVIPKTNEYASHLANKQLVCVTVPETQLDSLQPAFSNLRVEESPGLWVHAFSNAKGGLIITLCRDFLSEIYFPDRMKPEGIPHASGEWTSLSGTISFSHPVYSLMVEDLQKQRTVSPSLHANVQHFAIGLGHEEYFKVYRLALQ